MGSSSETCFFCGDDTENPQDGWSSKNSTNAQICRLCFLTLEQGTFCQLFHTHEDGWKNCDNCRKPIHYGCIMAFNTFELNGTSGVTCKECIMKSGDLVGAVSNSKDCFQLESYGHFTGMLTGKELLEEEDRLRPLNGDVKNSHEMTTEGRLSISESYNDVKNSHDVTTEGSLDISEPENSNLVFLFEKKLAPSDCDTKLGRLLVPRQFAEKFLPLVDGLQSMPLIVEDMGGQSWEFVLRWWLNKRSRKYVFYGTRKCAETMQWNAGDKIKFYRRSADGKLIIELERTHTITSESNVSVLGDGTNI